MTAVPDSEAQRVSRFGYGAYLQWASALDADASGQIERDWGFWARNDQHPPEGDWRTWFVMAGRGFGKTRMAAEYVRSRAEADGSLRIALVAATLHEARGTADIFVWALPQVARDGFVHFQIGNESEADVNAFDDVVFPLSIGRNAEVSAEFSTNVVTLLSGHERRNSDWSDARMSYDVAPGIRSEAEQAELLDFFCARRGAAIAFRFADCRNDREYWLGNTSTLAGTSAGPERFRR